MPEKEIKCEHCGSTITSYYSEAYKGNRGRCASCEVEFPLD